MLKKYIVRLSDAERQTLEQIVRKPKGSSQKVPRAPGALEGGRRRAGLTTKVAVTAADEDTAIAIEVLPGPATTPRGSSRCSTPRSTGCRTSTNRSATRSSRATPNARRALTAS